MATVQRAYIKSYIPVPNADLICTNETDLRKYLASIVNHSRYTLHFNEDGRLMSQVSPDEIVIETIQF